MSNRERVVPRSGQALAEVLEEAGDVAQQIRAAVHRSQLWAYTTGRRKPDADAIAFLHRVSDGRIAADGWATRDLGDAAA